MRRLAASALIVLAVCACAVPARATYSIPVSSFSEGTGKVSAGQQEIAFTVGQASPVGAGASGGYSLESGIVPAILDVAPPEIVFEPVALAAERTAVDIEAEIEDRATGVDSVVLYYRQGGFTSFNALAMEFVSGSTYRAEIPGSAVTERGLAYYIAATDARGNTSTVPEGAPDSLQNLPVYFGALTSDISLPSGEYRMVSLPATPTHGSPDSVLVDDFGSYDRTAWRLGRWNQSDTCTTGCYDEYPEIEDFAPGRAYWLILESVRSFDFSGISTDVSRPDPIRLARGWNQIATSYAFATDWTSGWLIYDGGQYSIGEAHVVGTDTIMVEDNLIAYDGDYENFQVQLGAWSGYWVYNAGTQEVDIAFPPRIQTALNLQAPLADMGCGVLFGIEAAYTNRDRGLTRSVCYIGIDENSSDAWDANDLHSPPHIDMYLRAAVRHDDWGRLSGDYMRDIRKASGDGKIYTVTLESPKEVYAGIAVTQYADLPDGYKAVLYDRELGVSISDFDRPYMRRVSGHAELELAVGTGDFLKGREAESGIELRNQLLSLIPNPFSEEVGVSFYLGAPCRVWVDVYNIEGALVARLADGVLSAGVHSRTWNGKTDSGDDAASGVYFLRLLADDEATTSKIIKLK